ncbi:MAG: hypothetical protein K2X87_07005 [Gemmataceae bacterium]|nr:hypothetical protein [Gemmataceae bacterium]
MLNDVAMFAVDPAALPAVAVVNSGTVTVTDQAGYSTNATYAPTLPFSQQGGGAWPILSLFFNPSGRRQLTENWTLAPVTDIDALRRIRCAFQLLVLRGGQTSDCADCRRLLEDFFPGESGRLDCLIPAGWYGVGCKADVPRDDCHVGRCGGTYAWVTPAGRVGLARFTMTVLELATGKPHAPTKTVVRTYKGDGTLDNTQVTTTEMDAAALDRIKKKVDRPDRRPISDGPGPVSPGLLFVPR